MRLLMVTRADVGTVGYLPHTLPILRRYAKEWGAEFMILDKSYGFFPWRVMIFHELLDKYERIFYIDADIIITKSCPNIFDAVPYDTIGLVFEDKGSRLKDRRARIAHVKSFFGGNEGWNAGYFNAGMFIVSRPHKELFTKINGMLWGDKFKVMGYEQGHLSYQLAKQGHKHVDLGYKWNHMSMFSESWNGSPSRFDSYIIHYAGNGKFPDIGERSRIQLIKDDVKKVYEE